METIARLKPSQTRRVQLVDFEAIEVIPRCRDTEF